MKLFPIGADFFFHWKGREGQTALKVKDLGLRTLHPFPVHSPPFWATGLRVATGITLPHQNHPFLHPFPPEIRLSTLLAKKGALDFWSGKCETTSYQISWAKRLLGGRLYLPPSSRSRNSWIVKRDTEGVPAFALRLNRREYHQITKRYKNHVKVIFVYRIHIICIYI